MTARLWLICPIWIVIAYSLSSALSSFKKRAIKVFCVLLLAMSLVVSGDSISTLHMANDFSCIYKINDESVSISDEILRLSDGDPVVLCIFVPVTETEEKYIEGGTIYRGIEQYTGLIDVHREAYTEEYWNDYFVSDMIPNNEMTCQEYLGLYLIERQDTYGFDYVAFPTNDSINSNVETLGYTEVARTNRYSIYCMQE